MVLSTNNKVLEPTCGKDLLLLPESRSPTLINLGIIITMKGKSIHIRTIETFFSFLKIKEYCS